MKGQQQFPIVQVGQTRVDLPDRHQLDFFCGLYVTCPCVYSNPHG